MADKRVAFAEKVPEGKLTVGKTRLHCRRLAQFAELERKVWTRKVVMPLQQGEIFFESLSASCMRKRTSVQIRQRLPQRQIQSFYERGIQSL